MNALGRILKALDYLRIRHPAKYKYDYFIPAALTVVSVSTLYLLPINVSIFGQQGIISAVTGLLQILTGFYIASLAAVATFDKPGMDDVMPGDKPMKLRVTKKGERTDEELTRRRLLCLMFGYMAFLSILLYFVGNGAMLLTENMRSIIPVKWHDLSKWFFVTGYLFCVSNLMITTCLGLYYMIDRIHQHDPKLLPKKKAD